MENLPRILPERLLGPLQEPQSPIPGSVDFSVFFLPQFRAPDCPEK